MVGAQVHRCVCGRLLKGQWTTGEDSGAGASRQAMFGVILPWELSTTFPITSIRTAKFRWEAIPVARPDAVFPALSFLLYFTRSIKSDIGRFLEAGVGGITRGTHVQRRGRPARGVGRLEAPRVSCTWFYSPGNRSGSRIGSRRVELVTSRPSLGSSNAPSVVSSSMKEPGRRSS